MLVSISPFIWFLVLECFLFLLFINTLLKQGAQKGDKTLILIFACISFLVIYSFIDALYVLSNPLPPPPDIWSEGYSDALLLRSWKLNVAAISGVILFITTVSYAWAKFRESMRIGIRN